MFVTFGFNSFFSCYSAMLEPSARYSAGGVGGGGGGAGGGGHALQIDTHHHSGGLETAVDLSRKATSETVVGGPGDLDADQDDSEDEAPLDLKVFIHPRRDLVMS
jgi:hypothetical protein